MKTEDVVYACTCDIAGKVRGKGFPAADFEKRLKRGIGWAPTNVQITCFDAIAESPFGSLGDMVLIPDPETRVTIRDEPLGLSEDFVLGDIRHTDGQAWGCCTRSILKAALERLERTAGLSLVCAFEHEFQFKGLSAKLGSAYTLAGFRERRRFAETLVAAMRKAGLEPDTVMKEYGAEQFEITNAPRVGVRAADEAVILREVVRAVALVTGEEVTFTPLRDPAGVGNGVHIHLSFLDADGKPATYDPQARHGLSVHAARFIAGVLKYLDSFVALTAPSLISYGRLTPHRWSAAFNNLGVQDREASVRICPVSAMSDIDRARQFNFEFRAADATASPYLQLAAIVHAGAAGIEEGLECPEATQEDLSLLSEDALALRGLGRLPRSLPSALERFQASETVKGWFAPDFVEVYRLHKLGEMAYLKDRSEQEIAAAYEIAY
ncbi:glutamine synthetase [Mesorhizobium sp. J18]|uniref:glutamine synthetase family protein n=1 Tax=Mesorhizobium sp. J18 TaxID=935263 RepID=UPI0011990EDC|nr:glutamine synthetase family protein [Mesorhizobium sp. J18]TWG95966.1 glutamine synthetase [Mesorhizobium sp. J18]